MNRSLRVAHVATVDLTVKFLLLEQLRRLRDEGYEVTAISAPGRWVEDLAAEGIRHIPWPHVTRAWSPGADVRAFRALLRLLRRERFDLVHTHNPKPGIMGRLAARIAGVPCIVNTVHGFYATQDDPPGRRIPVMVLERLAARVSDLELYQSREDLEWARRAGLVPESRSAFIGNGVDVERFDPAAVPAGRVAELRRELGIPSDSVVVGTVGRIVAEKGYGEFLAAARAVRASEPRVSFLAVGTPDAAKADSLSEEALGRARSEVRFAGWREDVRDLLAVMDVFVLASWREGVPRSAIEAAAMARPLVLTDIRGCREVVSSDADGILVPVRDPRRLTEAITRLVRNPGERERLGAAARALARDRFDERRVTDRIVSGYADLLARKGFLRANGGGAHVRPARPEDASVLSRIHREALPDSFLPALGDRFLRRLYRAMAADPGTVALVAEDGHGVVGFATGAVSVKAFYRRFFLRHGLPAAASASVHLLRSGMLTRVRETAAYPTHAGSLPESELLSIAVAPAWRSRGVGEALARGVVEGLGRRGAEAVRVVVSEDNEGANRFYARLGFREAARIRVHSDVDSKVWVIPCRSPSR